MNYKSLITQKAKELFELYPIHKQVYVTAESLTAGLIGASIVEIPGSSAYFDRGFITYSNEAKVECLGVSEDTLKTFGAVSENTVIQMATGALEKSSLGTMSVAVSGIAGPDGATKTKRVGTVWMAVKQKDKAPIAKCFIFDGSREEVREQTVYHALCAFVNLTKGLNPF